MQTGDKFADVTKVKNGLGKKQAVVVITTDQGLEVWGEPRVPSHDDGYKKLMQWLEEAEQDHPENTKIIYAYDCVHKKPHKSFHIPA